MLIEVSNRHVHLSETHFNELFGIECMQIKNFLSIQSECATQHQVAVIINGIVLPWVRVLGPVRSQTQVELLKSDVDADIPVRMSGCLAGSHECILVGPAGVVVLTEGVIIAQRHAHVHVSVADSVVSLPIPDCVIRPIDAHMVDPIIIHIDKDEAREHPEWLEFNQN